MSGGRRLPDWFGGSVLSLVLFLIWVDYLLIGAIVLGRAFNGAFTDRQEALLLAGFGLLAPLASWVCRLNLEMLGGPHPERWWWRLGTWTQPPAVAAGTVPWWERGRSAAIAVTAGSLFWMLYAGSLLAALVLPVAVWTMILGRLRRRQL